MELIAVSSVLGRGQMERDSTTTILRTSLLGTGWCVASFATIFFGRGRGTFV